MSSSSALSSVENPKEPGVEVEQHKAPQQPQPPAALPGPSHTQVQRTRTKKTANRARRTVPKPPSSSNDCFDGTHDDYETYLQEVADGYEWWLRERTSKPPTEAKK